MSEGFRVLVLLAATITVFVFGCSGLWFVPALLVLFA
jgi:hypothetical protein